MKQINIQIEPFVRSVSGSFEKGYTENHHQTCCVDLQSLLAAMERCQTKRSFNRISKSTDRLLAVMEKGTPQGLDWGALKRSVREFKGRKSRDIERSKRYNHSKQLAVCAWVSAGLVVASSVQFLHFHLLDMAIIAYMSLELLRSASESFEHIKHGIQHEGAHRSVKGASKMAAMVGMEMGLGALGLAAAVVAYIFPETLLAHSFIFTGIAVAFCVLAFTVSTLVKNRQSTIKHDRAQEERCAPIDERTAQLEASMQEAKVQQV